MNRVLLADDSPHAQRMGERILREEGFEVITVSDGDTAMLRRVSGPGVRRAVAKVAA